MTLRGSASILVAICFDQSLAIEVFPSPRLRPLTVDWLRFLWECFTESFSDVILGGLSALLVER
jgi:hypothetical protein